MNTMDATRLRLEKHEPKPERITTEIRAMLNRSSDSDLVGAVLALCDMFDEYDDAARRLVKKLEAVNA